MRKAFKKAIAMMMTLVMLAALSATSAFASSTTKLIRIYGDNRSLTSFAVADYLYEQSDYDGTGNSTFKHYTPTWKMLVCSGLGFADALSADCYVDGGAAPILLSTGGNTAELCDFFASHSRTDAWLHIVGGYASVSQDVENQLNATCDELNKYQGNKRGVDRTAGDDRFGTNYEEQLKNNLYRYTTKGDGVPVSDTLIIVSGEAAADGLSASAVRQPRMLVANSGLLDYQSEYIKEAMTGSLKNIIIIGGTAAVSQTVENQLKELAGNSVTVSRIAGENRYETSAKVADYFFPNAKSVVLAYGGGFADALCAGPFAQALDAPVVLTQEFADNADNPTLEYTNKLGDINVFAIGGAGSSDHPQLTDKAINAIKAGTIGFYKYS